MRMLPATAFFIAISATAMHAQTYCHAVQQDHYKCDLDNLVKKIAEAHTISIQTGRTDLVGADRTAKLVEKLGKQVAPANQRGDLTFALVQIDHSGEMAYGPATTLARLNVYDANRQLVWVETLDGDVSTPWAADVIELIKRFQSQAAGAPI